MICKKEYLLKVLRVPHISEKTSSAIKNTNTVVFKVMKEASKKEIKNSVQKLFAVEVKVVNTLIIKGKTKRYGKCIGRHKNWKKAYVTLKEGQNIKFIDSIE